jgi:hypothetical protein
MTNAEFMALVAGALIVAELDRLDRLEGGDR